MIHIINMYVLYKCNVDWCFMALSTQLGFIAVDWLTDHAASGPLVWNSLPLTVSNMSLTFTGFCSGLKTELYKQAYDGHTVPS